VARKKTYRWVDDSGGPVELTLEIGQRVYLTKGQHAGCPGTVKEFASKDKHKVLVHVETKLAHSWASVRTILPADPGPRDEEDAARFLGVRGHHER
jgi:transcription antitermination factor NusG